MANLWDSKIVSIISGWNDERCFDAFRSLSCKIQDDSTYWSVLGSLWKLCGSVKQQELWVPYFLSERRNRQKVMTSAERKALSRLPSIVTAYRAVNDDSEAEQAISWTLSEAVAVHTFSQNGKRKVTKRQFEKGRIFAYFNRRQEQEIIVLPLEGSTNA
ncbi:hypothetical protein [Vibrio fluvialis]|uniref:hypothetical protein n=2 Tax=Vibrio fluvialis TaxID=676 RepID=UPI001EECCEED|nr:hypothetical protein [Vibrio fluvialis]